MKVATLKGGCQERDDVPLDAPAIRDDGRRLLRPPAFPQDETCVQIIPPGPKSLFSALSPGFSEDHDQERFHRGVATAG